MIFMIILIDASSHYAVGLWDLRLLSEDRNTCHSNFNCAFDIYHFNTDMKAYMQTNFIEE